MAQKRKKGRKAYTATEVLEEEIECKKKEKKEKEREFCQSLFGGE